MKLHTQAQVAGLAVIAIAAGHVIPRHAMARAGEEIEAGDVMACHACARKWPISLIDAKPPPGEDPDSADFEIMQGPCCYGPGWSPL